MLYPTVDPETVKRKLKFDYLKARSDPNSRALDGVISILQHFQKPHLVIHDIGQDAATYIQKQFRLRWVIMGFRGADGMYRYDVMSGMRDEAWARQRTKVYALSDFTPTSGRYNYGDISKITRVYLEEQNPLYKEDERTVNRPPMTPAWKLTSLTRSSSAAEMNCWAGLTIRGLLRGNSQILRQSSPSRSSHPLSEQLLLYGIRSERPTPWTGKALSTNASIRHRHLRVRLQRRDQRGTAWATHLGIELWQSPTTSPTASLMREVQLRLRV
jgi:hypothetical protein